MSIEDNKKLQHMYFGVDTEHTCNKTHCSGSIECKAYRRASSVESHSYTSTSNTKKECCENWKCDCIHHYKREPNAIIPICSCHSPSNKDCECIKHHIEPEGICEHECHYAPTEGKKDWEEDFEPLCIYVLNPNHPRNEPPLTLNDVPFVKNRIKSFIRSLLTTEREKDRAIALDDAASLVEGWHYTKGGYTELAHQIRMSPANLKQLDELISLLTNQKPL